MNELRASFGDAVDMWDHYDVMNKSHVDISNFGEYFITTVEMLLISQRKVHVQVRGMASYDTRALSSLYSILARKCLYNVFTARCYASAVLAMGLCLCLCLSQVGVLLKRQNVGSHKQHHTILQGL